MGLHICYELAAPAAESEENVAKRIAALRDRALQLPFEDVSTVVRLTGLELSGPWPMRGLAFESLEAVANVAARTSRSDLYRRSIRLADDDYTHVEAPSDFPTLAIGFAVAPGAGSEPAGFGLARTSREAAEPWSWHYCCKTQYASVHGDEHFLRCHGSMIALLDAAKALGFGVVVRDETGFWDSRDEGQLLASVAHMNKIIAGFAGAFTDQLRSTGGDSNQVQGAIFGHPDFERLESDNDHR
jgi:hypothetical protein